jgi:molybdopterin-biosynthesis enzyme MoeA-like protein
LEDQAAIAIVERQYKMLSERGIVKSPNLTEPRKKMALIPRGAIPLDNQVGGAPGVMFEIDGKTIFCLPGVPAELKFIFEDSIEPWLERNVTQNYFEKIVELEWKDESRFSPIIDRVMMAHPGVYIKSMPRKYGTTDILRIWISARGKDRNQIQILVENAITSLAKEVGQSPKTVHPKDESR